MSTAGRKLCGIDAADDLVDELVADVAVDRLEHDRAVAELAAAAGLLLVAGVRARLLADRLEVRHARLVQLDVDAEAALGALERDLDVHLAHPGEDLLPGLLVAAQAERRVLLGEPADRRARPSPRRPSIFGVIGEAHHRLGEADLGHVGRDLLVEQQVAGLHLLQLRDGADVARAELLRRDVLLALLEEQRAHPLLRVRRARRRASGPA